MSPAKKLDEYIKLIRRDVAERIKIHHSYVLAETLIIRVRNGRVTMQGNSLALMAAGKKSERETERERGD
jgi:hypothetical protein